MELRNLNIPHRGDRSTEKTLSTVNQKPTEVVPAPNDPGTVDNPDYLDVLKSLGLRTEFITGPAGTGKTTEIRNRHEADPDGVVVAATTGIAAVNLGPEVTTIHSLLKFYNYSSLVDAYKEGKLQRNIRWLVKEGLNELIVDEISMFSGPAMDILYDAFHEVALTNPALALTVVGDFGQLPPIADPNAPETGKFAFESNCWRPKFSDHITRLTRVWRQDNEDFLHALQSARRGAGEETLEYLQRSGVRFEQALSGTFDGTTLISTNQAGDRYNLQRLIHLPGDNARIVAAPSTRWSFDGRQLSEWKSIPEQFHFKPGAYVMILSNDTPGFTWVNGDCGTVVGTEGNQVVVRLKRNGSEVQIGKITRKITTRYKPIGIPDANVIVLRNESEYDKMVRANGEPPQQVVMLREPRPTWITGWIRYYPLRLAYATTVHKSQGLSIDAIQLDLSSSFLAYPAMMYVALSRCRTPEGLVLVGRPEQVVRNTNVDPRVMEWL
jgi:ATP-dependent exoDNAse (exonuclease V) alpha subunit